jgi:transcriptional regulator with XRE-family HTH domain
MSRKTRSEQLRAFGLRVRSLRERGGISQEALADRAGLHRTYVGSVERGERNISLANIHRLADALGVAPSELLDERAARR